MNNNGETVFHSSNSGIINTNTNNKNFDIPNNYKPLSPSSYFGYSVLFSKQPLSWRLHFAMYSAEITLKK